MNLSILGDIVSKLSPVVGTALGGPMGGIIVTLLAKVFGVNNNDITNLAGVISADPEAQVKIKELEKQISDNQLEDMESARERDEKMVTLASAPNAGFVVSFIALVPHLLTMLTGAAILGIGITRILVNCTNSNDTLIALIVTSLIGIFMKQCAMYYGGFNKEDK